MLKSSFQFRLGEHGLSPVNRDFRPVPGRWRGGPGGWWREGRTVTLGAHALDPRGEARRVLVVEDEPSFRELMETVLRNAGHTVRAVPDARAARQALHDGTFDVIVTDLCTPDTSGTEMIVHLQQLGPRIPIIVISGTGAVEAMFRAAHSLGVRQALGKPFPLHELLSAVRNVTVGAT